MKDRTLLWIALGSAISGIIALIVIAETTDIDTGNVYTAEQDQAIAITGVVEKVTARGSITIVRISAVQKLDVVVFDDSATVSSGEKVKVTGTVSDYKGQREIVAERIDKA
jgi:hypothetical protein